MNKLFATVCGGLLIVGLTAGCGTARAPSAARPATASASALQSAPRATVTAVPAGTTQPSGGPVPAGFRAASVTFVSTREAFVLGTAPCKHAPCTSVARTLGRGVSWRGLRAPGVPLGEPYASTGTAAWGIRFATPEHGFVFGNGLWVTTDGGEHWPAVAYPGGAMLSLEVTGHQVLAVTARLGPDGLTGWTLSRRALGGGPWTRITALAGNSGAGGIAAQAGVAAVVDGSSVL